ncbi:MAG: peptide chain release factor N(5)-glutamine methyltransferase [bacterium]
MPITIKTALLEAVKKLQQTKIDSAHLDAEILLAHILKKTREFLFIHYEEKISSRQQVNFNKLIKRRLKLEPIAYLIGHKYFYGLDFIVNNKTLIPRPDTEIMVSEALNYLSEKINPTVIDLGCGSGAIAVAIKHNLPQTNVLAVDISSGALAVAKKNAKRHQTKIHFLKGSLLTPIKKQKIDLICANLPYLSDEIFKNNPELKYEPKSALSAGPKLANEADLYIELFKQYKKNELTCPLFLETHPSTNKLLKPAAKKYFPLAKVTIIYDLANRPRVFKIIPSTI